MGTWVAGWVSWVNRYVATTNLYRIGNFCYSGSVGYETGTGTGRPGIGIGKMYDVNYLLSIHKLLNYY